MSQPVWKRVMSTDYSQVFVDETGVYPPEMEISQEIDDTPESERFEVFRFPLDKLKVVKRDKHLYYVPQAWNETWPHPLKDYEEWFIKSLDDVASTMGTTEDELLNALVSDDWKDRAWAYESIGGHHGYNNLDGYPLTLSEDELNARWS